MRSLFIAVSKYIYKIIPSKSIKDIIYNIFAYIVRNVHKDVTISGITYHLDLGERIDLNIYLQSYEKDVCQAIDKLCQKGWFAADVGANIGVHSLRFAEKVGPEGNVFAFEPTSYAYKKLCKNISLNKFNNVKAYQIALSNDNFKNKEIKYKSSWRTYGKPIVETNFVDFKKFDDWYIENNVKKIDMIKIDVDGNEHSVLLGAKKVLSEQTPLILIEIGSYHFADESTNPLLLLKELTYKFWNINTFIEYTSIYELQELLKSDPSIDSVNIIAATSLEIAN